MKQYAPVIEIAELATRHSELLTRLRAGEEVVLADNGKPVGTVNPAPRKSTRQFNGLKDEIWIADDFDDPLPPELIAEFYK
jgi:antitoxin (DNA-binding transcriptional repressor) of toxin-antitoxin stability system